MLRVALLAATAGWAAAQTCSPKIASSTSDLHLRTGCSGDGAVLIQSRDSAGAVTATHNLTDMAAVQMPAVQSDIPRLSTAIAANDAVTATLRTQLAAAVAAAAGLRSQIMVNVSRIDATTARIESYARTTLGQQSTAIRSVQTTASSLQTTVQAIRTCNAQGRILSSNGRTCTYAHAMRCGSLGLATSDRTRRYTYDGTQPTNLVGSSYTGVCNARTWGALIRSYCDVDGTWSVTSATACRAWTGCRAGQYASRAPTPTSNTVCATCRSGQYQATNNYMGTSCRAYTWCNAGQYVYRQPSAAANTVCRACPSGYIQLASNYRGTSCRRASYGRVVGTGCSASSIYNGCYRCQNAYNNNWNDGCGRAWATRHQGAGSWYRMYFRSSYVGRIRFRQRNCGCEWYRRIQITFSNGQRRTINLARRQDQTITFPWVGPVTWAYMYFDQQWSRVNNGANEIQFQGFTA